MEGQKLKRDKQTSENACNIGKRDHSELSCVANPKSLVTVSIFHG